MGSAKRQAANAYRLRGRRSDSRGSLPSDSSTNKVSGSTSDHRWEPSSASGTTWLTTWTDFNALNGFSSSWNGSQNTWGTPFLHTTPAGNSLTGDLYAVYNAAQAANNLVMVDVVNFNLVFQRSTDSTGATWNAPVL